MSKNSSGWVPEIMVNGKMTTFADFDQLKIIGQVGYFVHNDYESDELRETPPETPDLTQPITRSAI